MSNVVYLKLFVDCLEKYQKLNDTEFGRLVRAALRYKATGAEPDELGREALLWDGMRLDIDRDNENYISKCSARAVAGKKGADARWQGHKKDSKNSKCHLPYGKNGQDKDKDKDKEEDTIPPIYPPQGGQHEQCGEQGEPPSPVPPEEKPTEYSADFTAFWKSYPSWRATDKAGCYRKFKKIPKETLPRLMESLEAHKKSQQWRDGIIPLASTWLNQRRWESDAPPEEPAKKPSRKGTDYPQHVFQEEDLKHLFYDLSGN